MTRKSRIDAPGALHHITARGIEGRKIFRSDDDRDHFIERLSGILMETRTRCLAWALMDNHFHLLLKTGAAPLPTVMRRLMTGYAVSFNLRYRRHGHLFQNRYRSILCQEEAYLAELVRYIHLNPVRARIVADIQGLDRYPYAGHSVLMGHVKREWQDTRNVLSRYGKTTEVARRHYRLFVQEGAAQGRRSDLVGGGLIRSAGGWDAVKALRKAGMFEKSDERILGDGSFVEEVLAAAEEHLEQKTRLRAQGVDLDKVAARVSELMELQPEQLGQPGKERHRVNARSLYCYWAVRELGVSQSALSRKLGISVTGIGQSVRRGERLVREKNYRLLSEGKIEPSESPAERWSV
jgi:REP element-mobilizing transposase RayT